MGSVVGGILGQNAAAGDRAQASNEAGIANQILQQIQQAPDVSKPLILQQYKQAGLLTPQMEQAISAGPSALSGVQSDAQSLNAQRQALSQLQQRSTQGLTAADRAALAQAQQGAQSDTQAKIGQILQQQQAQMGGQGSTGRTLAAELQAAQGGSNQEFNNANQVAQMAQQNALNATSQAGQLGGQINQQQFSEAAQKAAAADQMNRFNTQNQLAVQQQNVGAANQAQAGNLANLQGLNNQNVSSQNQELNNQLQRQMQQYGANVNTAQVQAGGANNYANSLNNQANSIAQGYSNIGSGVDQAATGIYGALNSGPTALQQAQTNYYNTGTANNLQNQGFWQGGMANFKQGGEVPGQAKMPGDHPANDTVHAKLSPGEIVVPRSLAESKIGKEMLKLIHAHNAVKNKMNGQD